MLGKERKKLINSRFSLFVSNDTKPIFALFLNNVFKSKAEESCEITLSTYGNLPMYVSLNGIVTENSEQCFVNVMNITDGKRAAGLVIANKELAFHNEEKSKRVAELVIAEEKRKSEEEILKKEMELRKRQMKLMVDRELTIIEIKKEVNELLKKSGLQEKYTTNV
jgi:hypothetical protein